VRCRWSKQRMSRWRLRLCDLAQARVVSQVSVEEQRREVAVDRGAQLVYQRRALVGPGRESWEQARELRTAGWQVSTAVSRVVVAEYERRATEAGE
jgi:hypothetical protein